MKKLIGGALAIALTAGMPLSVAAQGKGKGKGKAQTTSTETVQTHGKSATHKPTHTAPARSNKGGVERGQERADEVQQMNTTKKDTKATTTHGKSGNHGHGKKK